MLKLLLIYFLYANWLLSWSVDAIYCKHWHVHLHFSTLSKALKFWNSSSIVTSLLISRISSQQKASFHKSLSVCLLPLSQSLSHTMWNIDTLLLFFVLQQLAATQLHFTLKTEHVFSLRVFGRGGVGGIEDRMESGWKKQTNSNLIVKQAEWH